MAKSKGRKRSRGHKKAHRKSKGKTHKKKHKTKRYKPSGHPIVLKRSKRQKGTPKNWDMDKKRRALPPGKRISRNLVFS